LFMKIILWQRNGMRLRVEDVTQTGKRYEPRF
jgi:hypothetical protein